MNWLRPLLLIAACAGLATVAPWRAERPSGPGTAGGELFGGMFAQTVHASACQAPRQSERTFVGFRDGHEWLGDMEPAALEATRILKTTKLHACQLTAQEDADGTLSEALQTSAVAITAVLFEQEDLGSAKVLMQRVGRPSGRSQWSMRVARSGDAGDWRIVSVQPSGRRP